MNTNVIFIAASLCASLSFVGCDSDSSQPRSTWTKPPTSNPTWTKPPAWNPPVTNPPTWTKPQQPVRPAKPVRPTWQSSAVAQEQLCEAVFNGFYWRIDQYLQAGGALLGECNDLILNGTAERPTVLRVALIKGNEDVISALLKSGRVSGYQKIFDEATLFEFLMIKGHVNAFEILAKQSKGQLGKKTSTGLTLLAIALVQKSNAERLCKILLENGADANQLFEVKGSQYSPLELAIDLEDQRLIELLRKFGAKQKLHEDFKSVVQSCITTLLPDNTDMLARFETVRAGIDATCHYPTFEQLLANNWKAGKAHYCKLETDTKDAYQSFSSELYKALRGVAVANSADKCIAIGGDTKSCNDKQAHFNACFAMAKDGKNLDDVLAQN